MALKRERSISPVPLQDIFRSPKVDEQTSSFIAAFSPTFTVKELQALPEFRSATHRIAAWRKRSQQRSLMPDTKILYDLGHDDDGEKWAGSRLQRVLADTEIEGVVVVARWYGGQNIGPIRFTHIENTAKQAIWSWRVADQEAQKGQSTKKQKLEEETARKALENQLLERDLNIIVLRKMLADKKAKLDDSDPAPSTPQKPPPSYGKMSLEALKKIDKARDASIAFVLKQIDKVDGELKLIEDLDDSSQESWKDAEEHKGNIDPAALVPVEEDRES